MILSTPDLHAALQTGHLSILPVTDRQFTQNGIDLVLAAAQEVGQVGLATRFRPRRLYLGVSLETLRMPDDLMGFIELRSTWGRSGCLLPPTVVDAGFEGTLTLEIFYAGPKAIPVPIGERFAHVIFARLTSPAPPYRGKYQHQTGITGPIPDPERPLPPARRRAPRRP